MRKVQVITVIAGLLFLLTASAQNKQAASGTNKIEPLPQDLEIQLALSALPSHLRDNATVYVFSPWRGVITRSREAPLQGAPRSFA